jgi:hypothetical protein
MRADDRLTNQGKQIRDYASLIGNMLHDVDPPEYICVLSVFVACPYTCNVKPDQLTNGMSLGLLSDKQKMPVCTDP